MAMPFDEKEKKKYTDIIYCTHCNNLDVLGKRVIDGHV